MQSLAYESGRGWPSKEDAHFPACINTSQNNFTSAFSFFCHLLLFILNKPRCPTAFTKQEKSFQHGKIFSAEVVLAIQPRGKPGPDVGKDLRTLFSVHSVTAVGLMLRNATKVRKVSDLSVVP